MNKTAVTIIILLLLNIAFGRRLDGVIFTTAQNALGHLFSVSVESAITNLIDVNRFYIISTNSELLEKKYHQRWGHRVKFVDETVFNITKTEVVKYMIDTVAEFKANYTLNGKSPIERELTHTKGGWYLQQILKVRAGKVLKLQDYVVLDSDLVWMRPLNFRASTDININLHNNNDNSSDNVNDSGGGSGISSSDHLHTLPRYNYAYSTQYHGPYAAVTKKLVGIIHNHNKSEISVSGIVHHMVFVKEVMADIVKTVRHKHKLELWQAMLKFSALELVCHFPRSMKLAGAGSVLSEYEMYFHYARQKWASTVQLRPLLWANGPNMVYQFWPSDTTKDKIPPVCMRKTHWKFNRHAKESFEWQVKADTLSGYDFVGYHSYAHRRYFELRWQDVNASSACSKLQPDTVKPWELSVGSATSCSWKDYNSEVTTEESWFENCACYAFRLCGSK